MMKTSLSGNADCHLSEVTASGRLAANPEIAVTINGDPQNSIVPILDTRGLLLPDEYVTALDGRGDTSRALTCVLENATEGTFKEPKCIFLRFQAANVCRNQ